MESTKLNETVELIESWGSDCIRRFGGKYQGGIWLQQEPREMANLILLLQEQNLKDINYLEVGCAAGGFTYVMNHFLDLKNIILIDDNSHKAHTRLKKTLRGIKYNKLVGDSQSKQARDHVMNLDLQFDIIFIDADHNYHGVKKDTLTYLPFLKEGGFLILHDVEERAVGVKKWATEMIQDKRMTIKHVANFIQNRNGLGIGVYQK